jgi:CRISPR/Cas system-associated endonuclease/helicase Cas3
MVLLTATLPPGEEEELYRRMYFKKDQVKMFRARTARVNVAYRVVNIGGLRRREEKESVVLELIRKKVRKCGTGKVVVYYNTVGKAKRIVKALGCDAYYHDIVGKDSILIDFMEGK